jgi:hypothetical protein
LLSSSVAVVGNPRADTSFTSAADKEQGLGLQLDVTQLQ